MISCLLASSSACLYWCTVFFLSFSCSIFLYLYLYYVISSLFSFSLSIYLSIYLSIFLSFVCSSFFLSFFVLLLRLLLHLLLFFSTLSLFIAYLQRFYFLLADNEMHTCTYSRQLFRQLHERIRVHVTQSQLKVNCLLHQLSSVVETTNVHIHKCTKQRQTIWLIYYRGCSSLYVQNLNLE